jgi:hypothetical protein
MSDQKGTRVTARDISTGETESSVIEDNYVLVTDGDCYVADIQHYPKSGTHVITVKNVGGKR